MSISEFVIGNNIKLVYYGDENIKFGIDKEI